MHAVLPAQDMNPKLQNRRSTHVITPYLLHTQQLSERSEGRITLSKGVNFKMSFLSIGHLRRVMACVKYFTYYNPRSD
jgi:hypothetical protein